MNIQYTLYNLQFAIYNIQYTIYNIQYNIQIQYTNTIYNIHYYTQLNPNIPTPLIVLSEELTTIRYFLEMKIGLIQQINYKHILYDW